ncbi:MAG TPA: PilT/PilU family type 4a pilus ATPase [Burkholderiaceae bacterium]|jgi:twitching motility protein PilU|nr:PilT/PilU family type 4a pilus ATPase [Burkholderiaceae bacterium]HPE02619.1 PilT/PilU family type 4a pilus ATPase [Burkholderiaceae bacterium]HRZ01894.1 PilT/PilU family type 4a pilus ATPase [Burkholderiaceae bacterium]
MSLERLFTLMSEKNASDLFLAVGSPITIKINGVAVPISQERLAQQGVIALLAERLSDAQFRELESTRELNVALPVTGVGSFRLSAFMQRGSISAVIRFIPHEIPKLDSLSLPEVLKDLILERRGLILVVGSAGSGKSTTIASMIDHRNELATGHVLTFEDPIEFLFRNKKAIINQREIGTDAQTLHAALRNAMRQAPDVIFIGEIRDRETMTAAISYAMSGHLVVATLHATNAAHTLNRVISFYPPETRQALFQDLSVALKAILSQRLVRARKGGRVPAVEVLINNRHIADLIERGDVQAIKEALEQSLAPESSSYEQSLYALLQSGLVTRDDALAAADSQNNLLWFINNSGKPQKQRDNAAAPTAPDAASFAEFTLNI